MQAITSLPIDRYQASHNMTGPRLCRGIGYLCLAGTSYLAVLALRVSACVVSIFGKCGRNWAEKIRSKADRFYVIHVGHNIARLSTAPLPLLAPARNMAHRDVVRKGEDIAAANALRQRFLSPGFLKKTDPKMEAALKKVTFKGAQTGGICLGASFSFVKSVLNARCGSEKELQRVANTFAQGFSKEAAGLQAISENVHWPLEPSKKANQAILDLIEQQKEEVLSGVEDKHQQLLREARIGPAHKVIDKLDKVVDEEAKKAKKHFDNLEKRMPAFKFLAQKTTRYGNFAKLIGLKLLKKPMHDLLQFDAAAKRRFNALPKGNYLMAFFTKKSGHAISYHKFDFGSYLYDPNRGLMKCQSNEPAKDLEKLLKIYPGRYSPAKEGAHQLQLYPCELAKLKV